MCEPRRFTVGLPIGQWAAPTSSTWVVAQGGLAEVTNQNKVIEPGAQSVLRRAFSRVVGCWHGQVGWYFAGLAITGDVGPGASATLLAGPPPPVASTGELALWGGAFGAPAGTNTVHHLPTWRLWTPLPPVWSLLVAVNGNSFGTIYVGFEEMEPGSKEPVSWYY